MKTRIILSLSAFVFVQLLGFFTAWIGGVQPFTGDAGFAAYMSIGVGFIAIYIVWEVSGDAQTDR